MVQLSDVDDYLVTVCLVCYPESEEGRDHVSFVHLCILVPGS